MFCISRSSGVGGAAAIGGVGASMIRVGVAIEGKVVVLPSNESLEWPDAADDKTFLCRLLVLAAAPLAHCAMLLALLESNSASNSTCAFN